MRSSFIQNISFYGSYFASIIFTFHFIAYTGICNYTDTTKITRKNVINYQRVPATLGLPNYKIIIKIE